MPSRSIQSTIVAIACALLVACSDDGGSSGGSGTQVIEPLPKARGLLPDIVQSDDLFETEHFTGSGVCSDCHNGTEESPMTVPDDSGVDKDVSIGKAWRTSVMANSTRDPYWHAVMASELDDFPMLEDEIADTCTRCHAPMANEYAKKEGIDFRLFDKGSIDAGTFQPGIYDFQREFAENGEPVETVSSTLFDHAMDGVSCTLCHQISDAGNLGDESSFTGGYVIEDPANLDYKPAYGQYAGVNASYMLSTGYLAQQAAHISTSETCATCHNLDVQPVDENGATIEGIDKFAEQANYTEWLFSDYSNTGPTPTSCQDCHMPKLEPGREVLLASAGAEVKRQNFAEHTFLGANTVMQTMFRDFSDELGIPDDITDADWNESIARNREFLQGSATLELAGLTRAALPASDDAEPAEPREELAFDVTVVNQTGHKLPTGYHSRRVIAHVTVTRDNSVVWESGAIEADGRIIGNAEDVNAHDHEVHYDLITDASQVQVYQAVVGDEQGERTGSLLAGSRYLKDNRILPKGFDKNAVAANESLPDSFGTFGAAMTDDDFNAGSDTVSYRVAVPAGGDYRVQVQLRYQPLAFGHLQELFAKGDRLDTVDMFRTIYDQTSLRDEVIATAIGDLPGN